LLVALLGGFATALLGAAIVVVALKLVPPLHADSVREAPSLDPVATKEELEALRQVVLKLRAELSESRREAAGQRYALVPAPSPRTYELKKRQQRERDDVSSRPREDDPAVGFAAPVAALSQ
jgi:hypothetical protein